MNHMRMVGNLQSRVCEEVSTNMQFITPLTRILNTQMTYIPTAVLHMY